MDGVIYGLQFVWQKLMQNKRITVIGLKQRHRTKSVIMHFVPVYKFHFAVDQVLTPGSRAFITARLRS
jgi:hypothetical protein